VYRKPGGSPGCHGAVPPAPQAKQSGLMDADEYSELLLNQSGATKPTAPQSAPKMGTIKGGYVFMGGDPGKKSSWKKK